MKIILLSAAEKQLRKLPKIDQLVIAQKIRSIKSPSDFQSEKLAGFNNIYRIRVGNYRIVYKAIKIAIYIILIQHRKDVYKMLKDLLN